MSKNRASAELDGVDRAMLRLLQDDGALSNATLGEKLSLSVTPCWRRRKRLEDEGVITGYQANLDRRALGMNVFAFVQVTFNMHSGQDSDHFEDVMRRHDEVTSCHKITGAADYILQVVAADLDAYAEFVERVLRKQAGVSSIQSSLALREVKFSSRVPVPGE
ncbi:MULTISPECIES: Lrp/AsnC family transcriptional regulator [Burkholderia cepacia complex]|uniref:AsnC family transcriptional regulator n=2 Tax=Burkholderia cepacia complex TaxID=87882 RepID=A0A6J5JLR6_9BURK|nr:MULTISPECIES: Lrp/AsnC family transcriptional regulator [Burkholderia cepacia complex]CAB3972763.1 AsnC family transcriptional regulator [Burkholderia cenocepacia]VWD39306.1 AsnC family transcriptional regulator [Burkholderia contaminans]